MSPRLIPPHPIFHHHHRHHHHHANTAPLAPNRSAWEGYKANNYTNDYTTNPLFDGTPQDGDLSAEFGDGITTPGLVQMYVCPLSSLLRADTLIVGTIPNLTSFAPAPCPDPTYAYFNCVKLPCNGVST